MEIRSYRVPDCSTSFSIRSWEAVLFGCPVPFQVCSVLVSSRIHLFRRSASSGTIWPIGLKILQISPCKVVDCLTDSLVHTKPICLSKRAICWALRPLFSRELFNLRLFLWEQEEEIVKCIGRVLFLLSPPSGIVSCHSSQSLFH